jgi:hypothetical protein
MNVVCCQVGFSARFRSQVETRTTVRGFVLVCVLVEVRTRFHNFNIPNKEILPIKCVGKTGRTKKQRKRYNDAMKQYLYILTQLLKFPKETDMG